MEIDHGCLGKGMLNQELSNGLSRHGEETNGLEGATLAKLSHQHQETLACLPQTQGWRPGNLKGSSTHQQQEEGWSDQSTSSLGNSVDIENARTLVAFSASAGSLPPCSVAQPTHNPTTHLYEKFNREMANRGVGDKQKTWSRDDQHCTSEDLNTLQLALNQARHGHKPPNCDCDGPDCPDYLEWLEKKIKIAGNSHEKGFCKLSGASQTEQQHYQSEPQPQPNSANIPQSQNPPNHPPAPRPYRPLPPIPCSPSVLSIAKERNVSLQTAIAIEALTQLSGTGGPLGESTFGNNNHHALPQLHSQTQDGMRLTAASPGSLSSSPASTIPQPFTSGHFPQKSSASWEQHRADSPGPAHQSSLYRSSNSPFSTSHPSTPSPSPHQWQQSTGASCEKSSPRNPWMLKSENQACFPQQTHGSSDPMSELKQLLGDSSGKYTSTTFRFPAPSQNLKDNLVMAHVKPEVNNGDFPGDMAAALGQYRMLNNQQQFQGQQISQSVRYSTQAALQQHLHHKRNLFTGPQTFDLRAPMACQTLRKWWPQSTPESALPIKQEPREPKKKKNTQSSPLLKQPVGGLLGSLGPPLPKPKQIIIKKTKQKASQPLFLPQKQITVQKSSMSTSIPSLTQPTPSLPVMEAALPPCLPSYNSSQVVVSHAAPAQSQESFLNSISTPFSRNTPLGSNTLNVPVPPAQDKLTSSVPTTVAEGTLATTTSTSQTTTTSQSTPPLCGLNSLDPKFEELIRQFEEEFGDTSPVTDTTEQGFAPDVVTESHSNSNSGQGRPHSPEKFNNLPVPRSEPEPNLKQAEGENEKFMSSNQLSAIKQEIEECEVDVKPSDQLLALATEAYLQQQHHKILVNPFTTTCSPPAKRMKIESSGGVTVLSTTASLSTAGENLDTPTKESFPSSPSLKGFLESPLHYLDTPTKSLLDTPIKNAQTEFPTCDCVEQIIEKDEGPYYNHLGSGPTVASIRELMESRYGEKGDAVRIEKVVYTGREGKSSQGCPIAKWVIRRSSEKEKLLCLVRQRAGHHCANAVIIVVIIAWEGIPKALGDKLYREITDTLIKYGNPTSRRCGLNEDRTCACQGKDPETCGASFSFGCSWSMYFNGCKYARSKTPRKFRLQGEHPKEEEILRDNFQELATKVAPVYRQLAPQAYQNQCATEKLAPDCRLGLQEGRPFSGITACMDFCAHAHKDQHNLHNGCTVVCTLTKEDNRAVGVIPEDEQLHVLPLYKLSLTDEFGSEENQRLKMQTGAIQVLSKFRREVRKLPEPAKSCRQRRLEAKKAASEKKNKKQQLSETPEKTIKKEVSLHGNKAIPKQEVKPTIKKEPVDHFQAINGALDGFSPIGNAKMCPDPYSMNGAYSSCPAPYARGSLPSISQSSTHSPINGFHPNLQGMPYNYYNHGPKGLLPPEVLGCVNNNGTSHRAAGEERKPCIQSLQARLVQNHADHHHQQGVNMANHNYLHQSELSESTAPLKRTPSAPPDQMHRVTPNIKQEPMEVPLYDSRTDGQFRSCPVTPSVTPQPDTWPVHTLNGSLAPKGWDGNFRPAQTHSPFTPEKQRFHQQLHNQLQHSKYAQQQQQWRSHPGTPVASPSPAPAVKTGQSPAPSPHPVTPQHWGSPAPSPQPISWGQPGSLGYGHDGFRQGTPIGAFPDKMLAEAAEIRGSTPLGLQEKAWKSGGASAAGSNPSPAPEGRLFPDTLQKVNGQACWDSEVESEREPEEEEVWSDSEHNFLDPNIGGVAVAPAHGSILIECARRELHATTPLKKPDRGHPTRISLVFYQHKNLNQPCHGLALWEAKMKLLAERARQRQQEAALLGLSQEDMKAYTKKRKWADGLVSSTSEPMKDKREVMTRLAPTQHTTNMVTVSPYAFTRVTGPYSCFM